MQTPIYFRNKAILQLLVSLVITLNIFPSHAMIAEFYGTFSNEHSFELEETGASYKHLSNYKLFDNFGIGIGFRGGFEFVGLSFDAGWKGHSPKRTEINAAIENENGYRFETSHGMIGGYFALPVGGGRLIGEYFPINTAWVGYSDEDGVNPFRKGDTLQGTAFTVGFGTNTSMMLTILYRERNYSKIKTSGIEHNLPDNTYSKFKIQEVVLQGGFHF